mmetsp:Transcript_56772/g.105064  ORF Transcript_56772/g.105064 Transcript_56772/m.105064 type:complete len:221 (-) Transcript_56772:48-710(-)
MQSSRSTIFLTSCLIYVAFADRGELAAPTFTWEHSMVSHAATDAVEAVKGSLEQLEQTAKQATAPITASIDPRTCGMFALALVGFARLCWSMLLELKEKTSMLSKVEQSRLEQQQAVVPMSPRSFARKQEEQAARAALSARAAIHPAQGQLRSPAESFDDHLRRQRGQQAERQRAHKLLLASSSANRSRSLPKSPKQVPPTAAHRPSRSMGPLLTRSATK